MPERRLGGAPTETPRRAAPVDGRRFDAFVREHYQGLLQFLMHRLGNQEDAEDVAQDGVAKLLRYRNSVPPADWPRLLYRIAINAANDRFRHERRHREIARLVAIDSEVVSPEYRPDEFAVHQCELMRVRQAMLGLPPKCRHVYLLRVTRGMTNAQIAQQCGISVKMVEKHLAKGLAMIRRRVGNLAADPFK